MHRITVGRNRCCVFQSSYISRKKGLGECIWSAKGTRAVSPANMLVTLMISFTDTYTRNFQRTLPQMTRWCLPALVKINDDLRLLASGVSLCAPLNTGNLLIYSTYSVGWSWNVDERNSTDRWTTENWRSSNYNQQNVLYLHHWPVMDMHA